MAKSPKNRFCLLSVSNDTIADHRVHRTCSELINLGYTPVLFGRAYENTPPLAQRQYRIVRPKFFFRRNALFYVELQFRLLFFLLRHRADLLWANDLDTLFPNYLVSKWKRIPLIYDSHECFTEVPELLHNAFAKKTWLRLERFLLPKLQYNITVCQGIADYYHAKYQTSWVVIRNVPFFREGSKLPPKPHTWPRTNALRTIIYQGSLNDDRGLEELIEAMTYVMDAALLILGDGLKLSALKDLVRAHKLENTVFFLGYIPLEQLRSYTPWADLGVSLEKDVSTSYHYCLPNKVFDYIQARIPQLVSPLPEIANIIDTYDVGRKISSHDPRSMAQSINELLADSKAIRHYKNQTNIAAELLCWDCEKKGLKDLIHRVESERWGGIRRNE